MILINAAKLSDKASAHEYLRKKFGFGEHYGANLDALYDCLSERKRITVYILNADCAGDYYKRVMSVMADCANIKVFAPKSTT